MGEVDERVREVGEMLDASLDVAPVAKLSLTSLEKEARRAREAGAKEDDAGAGRFADLRQAVVRARNAAALDTGVPHEVVRTLDEVLELVHELDADHDR